MELRNRTTGEVLSESSFRATYSNVSFPKVLKVDTVDPFGWDIVLPGQPPTPGAYETVVRQGVEEVNGTWRTKYVVVPMFVDDENGTAAEKITAYEQGQALRRMKGADYLGFWQALIRSTVYATIKADAKLDLTANVLATELISLLGDAKAGNVDIEALQAGIWEIVATLSPELVTELDGLMDTYGMTDYTLTPPA